MAQVGANMEYQEYKWAYSIMDSSKVSACLISMLLIVYGSFRSLNMEREARERAEREREATLLGGMPAPSSSGGSNVQTLNTMQALCFPLGSSVALLIMFFFFDSMQTLVAICTAIIACAALAFLLTPLCQYMAGGGACSRGAVCGRYSPPELAAALLSAGIVAVWVLTGHWLLMDAMGMGLCVTFIALIRLPSLKVSTLLLTGLLLYDVFWVFFSSYIFTTNVMVKVATSSSDDSSRRRRVTFNQLETLWEFLNSHKEIATGYNKSAQAREHSRRMWESIAEALNSQGEGAVKDWKGWSSYWVDYKAKLKKRVAVVRAAVNRTGGGPLDVNPLSDIEKKFLGLLGDGFGVGLPNIQVDPFPTTSSNTASLASEPLVIQVEEAPPTPEVQHEVEILVVPQEPQESQEALQAPPVPQPERRRRRRRDSRISQEAARHTLVELSRERLQLETRIGHNLEQLLNILERIANTLDRPAENPMNVVARRLQLGGAMRDAPKLSLPAKLVFPSMHHQGHFSMLGLGDIVMPGLLLCFVLRYDAYKKATLVCQMGQVPGPRSMGSRLTYFHCSLLGYFLGLLTATVSAEVFKAAQPALLYLVPFTLLPLLTMAYLKGDLRRMWSEPFIAPPNGKAGADFDV